MELVALYKRVIGLDIHQAQITACALIEEPDGSADIEQRQFGAFKRDRRELAEWVSSLRPDEVVMESTGIYWKSPYAALEAVGIRAKVVNARHVMNVPGCKTDVGDAHWQATLARAGLLRGSFVPPAKLRELRLIARQRQKLVGQLASEKNRLHKVLTDSGVRLGVVVSDLHGQSARAMVKAIIAGQSPQEVLKLASRRLKASREEIFDALQGELTASHCFVLDELMRYIEEIEARIVRFDTRLLAELDSERNALALLQTIPGIDLIGAAMLLVEIGTDMETFGSADRLASWVGIQRTSVFLTPFRPGLVASDMFGRVFQILTPVWKFEIMAARRKTPQHQEIYAPKDVAIPAKLGGGVLKERVIRELPSKVVVCYALAYVNPLICSDDNGRVLGYDNSHGFSHRHYMGEMTREPFPGYEALYERFEREWREIALKFVNGDL